MNQIAWQIFGGSKSKANTFIGGVASVITTSGALATRLGIASNRITNFKIVGSDIECSISGSYVIPKFCTGIELLISYYRDFDGLVTSIGLQSFYSTNVREVYTPNATSIGLAAFDQNLNNGQDKNDLKMLYIPRVTTIGTTVLNNNVFRSGNLGGGKIYAHPSLQTINAGGVEGDLAYLATGNIVRYVTNFTAPSPINDLSIGTIYATAVQLNFTAPTGSANAIEFYECYANGVYKNRITASGQYITGLNVNTNYTIEVKPVDIFYNKSTSNTFIVNFYSENLNIVSNNLALYYDINNPESYIGTGTAVNDISGNLNNGLLINGTGYSSLDGGSLVFDGINDYVSIPNPIDIASQNFTISIWIKPLAPANAITTLFDYDHGTAGSTQGYVIQSEDATTNRKYYLAFYTNSGFQPSGFIGAGKGVQITNGIWQMLTYVKNGNLITGYINDVELYRVTAANGTVVFIPNKNASIGTAISSTGRITKGNIAKNMIYNRALTESEIAFNFSQTRSLYGV